MFSTICCHYAVVTGVTSTVCCHYAAVTGVTSIAESEILDPKGDDLNI
jgi:hypothetical protein